MYDHGIHQMELILVLSEMWICLLRCIYDRSDNQYQLFLMGTRRYVSHWHRHVIDIRHTSKLRQTNISIPRYSYLFCSLCRCVTDPQCMNIMITQIIRLLACYRIQMSNAISPVSFTKLYYARTNHWRVISFEFKCNGESASPSNMFILIQTISFYCAIKCQIKTNGSGRD